MQENRSFDNMFNGFPGTDTAQSGMSNGVSVPLSPIPIDQGTDLDHSHPGWWKDWNNGKLDGFSHEPPYPIPDLPYAFVPESETVPYWTLAKQYTLGDRMFQSNTGPSYPAHQYMIAAQSQNASENPNGIWGCDAAPETRVWLVGPNGTDLPGVFPCFDYRTLADNLDAKGITWRYYAPQTKGTDFTWSAFEAIRHIRFGPNWKTNVIAPETKVLTDIQNGDLAQVTWICPSAAYSDHAGTTTKEGPDWVASITNAIGASPFWDSTAVFISWDDWGGWYDHVDPPYVDQMGLGFRVPVIVVSPYAKHGYISHQTHEASGFLKYTEEVFALQSLGQRDVATDDFADCFDYNQPPQPYTPIPVTFTPKYFVNRKPSGQPDYD